MQQHRSVWTDLAGVSFSQRFIDAGGVRTRLVEAGDPSRPAVMFLHGTGGHIEAFSRAIGPHAERFHVYAIDLVGHGYTAKPPLAYELADYSRHVMAVMDAEGLDTVALSGESLGGDVAAWMAYHHPERLDAVSLNTGAAFAISMEVAERFSALSLAAVDDPTPDRIRERLSFLFRDPSMVTDDLVAVRTAIYRQEEMPATMRRILTRLTDPAKRERNVVTPEQWKEVEVPVMVIWTTNDPTADASRGREVASGIPGSRFELIEGCGHWPQFEDPATFNRIHLDFLERSAGRRRAATTS